MIYIHLIFKKGIQGIELTGNFEVDAEGVVPPAELKQKLIQLAQYENLDFAYILRSMAGNGMPLPLLLYKVDLPDNSLREVSNWSSERLVHNTQFGGGLPISLIDSAI